MRPRHTRRYTSCVTFIERLSTFNDDPPSIDHLSASSIIHLESNWTNENDFVNQKKSFISKNEHFRLCRDEKHKFEDDFKLEVLNKKIELLTEQYKSYRQTH